MSAEVSLEIPAADYADLDSGPAGEFLILMRFEVYDELEKAVVAAGGTFDPDLVDIRASITDIRLLIQGSHP